MNSITETLVSTVERRNMGTDYRNTKRKTSWGSRLKKVTGIIFRNRKNSVQLVCNKCGVLQWCMKGSPCHNACRCDACLRMDLVGKGGGEAPFVPERVTAPTHAGIKVGRNEPCVCRSGKKYKKCCLGA